ncbi:hypothetical protein [Kitasatospora sp. NPDC085879]
MAMQGTDRAARNTRRPLRRTSRRWFLTRRLHIDLLRVCSACRPAA